jgi:hypothetical protein
MNTGLAALGSSLIVLLCALWWIFRNRCTSSPRR